MNGADEQYLKQLQAAFKIEADDHLQAMSSGLLTLESSLENAPGTNGVGANAVPMPLIESIYRDAHSLKGAARAVNMAGIESVCQSLENIFAAWKRQKLHPAREQFDALHNALDVIGKLLAAPDGEGVAISSVTRQLAALKDGAPQEEQQESSTVLRPSLAELHQQSGVNGQSNGVARPPTPPAEQPSTSMSTPAPEPVAAPEPVGKSAAPQMTATPSAVPETVRIATSKLDALLLQAEEMLTAKLKADRLTAELCEAEGALQAWRKEWVKIAPELRDARKSVEKSSGNGMTNGQAQNSWQEVNAQAPSRDLVSGKSPKLLDFLDWNCDYFRSLEERLTSLRRNSEADQRELAGLVDNLLDDTKKLLMLPFSTLLGSFPKLVRDLARDEEKDVQLSLRGSEIEIDKRILEEIKDPLIHLLRNAVDHGIETPDERARQNKPARATINLVVTQTGGGEVEMLVSDDGAGIDVEQVKASAVQHGLTTAEEATKLDEAQGLALIFQSDLSTSPIITEISGRGLGLAIVREKVEKLGGRVAVETQPGKGTTFRIGLPLTLATFRGILVQAGGQLFVIPSASVERVVRIRESEVRTLENRQAIALTRAGSGQDIVSLAHLHEVLELPPQPNDSDPGFLSLVVLGVGEKRIAFAVADVLSEQEVLVKKLGHPLARVRNIAGATVLGSGDAATILHVSDLLQSVLQTQTARPAANESEEESAAEETTASTRAILIAEDSITSRMLLKNILESAGFRVTTAVDGAAAWSQLREQKFDLVVSDVDMPRMDGFDLTAKIRGDRALAELPVVLVTGRDAREDKERGIDVGANAYIIKSSFDQSNLLDVIRRLI